MTQPESWSRRCPACNAPIGRYCVTTSGHRSSVEHTARRDISRTNDASVARACPECGAERRNPETLRAHRGIAHGVTT